MLFAARPEPAQNRPARLQVMDLATKKRAVVGEPGAAAGFCWSPDGSRLAYCWQKRSDDPSDRREKETFLFTCDPSGKRHWAVTNRRLKGSFSCFTVFDWR